MLFRLPNLVTMVRLLAAPLVAWLLYLGYYRSALILLGVAGVSDWLDGYSARKLGMSNPVGVILDPLADKVLMVVVFVAMGLLRLIPFWLFTLVVARDLVIVCGALLLRLLRHRREFAPSLLGKISTFFQIVFALVALVYAAFPYRLIEALKITGMISTAIFTLLSGADYVRQGISMARMPPLQKK